MSQVKDKNTYIEEFNPMQNFVVASPVQLEKGEEVTESGIVIGMSQNQSVTDRPTTGTVVSVGPDCKHIKVGYEIYWPSQDGLDMSFKNGDFMMFREDSIIGYKTPKEK